MKKYLSSLTSVKVSFIKGKNWKKLNDLKISTKSTNIPNLFETYSTTFIFIIFLKFFQNVSLGPELVIRKKSTNKILVLVVCFLDLSYCNCGHFSAKKAKICLFVSEIWSCRQQKCFRNPFLGHFETLKEYRSHCHRYLGKVKFFRGIWITKRCQNAIFVQGGL